MEKKENAKILRAFLAELSSLREKEIIPEEVFLRLQEHFKQRLAGVEERKHGKVMIFCLALSALLCALGLALIIGYNWDDFPTSVRLTLGFLPFLPGAGLLLTAILRKKGMLWTEPGFLFHTIGIGTALAVTTQICHLGGTFQDFLLYWSLLILPLFLLGNSSVVLPVAAWTLYFLQLMDFHSSANLFLLLYPLLPTAFLLMQCRRMPESFAGKAAAFCLPLLLGFSWCFSWTYFSKLEQFTTLFLIFGALFAAGSGLDGTPEERLIKGRSISEISFLVLTIGMLCFSAPGFFSFSPVKTIFRADGETLTILTVYWVIALLFMTFRSWKQKEILFLIPVLFPAVFAAASAMPSLRASLPFVFSFLSLLCGTGWIRRAVKAGSLSALNGGGILILGVVAVWFLTGSYSMLTRGIAFLILGTLFGAGNLIFLRKCRRKGGRV